MSGKYQRNIRKKKCVSSQVGRFRLAPQRENLAVQQLRVSAGWTPGMFQGPGEEEKATKEAVAVELKKTVHFHTHKKYTPKGSSIESKHVIQ